MDQADGLRSISGTGEQVDTENTFTAQSAGGIRVIAMVSGKGGVGKTNLSANLAVVLAQRGRKVLLVDADLGLALCLMSRP